MKTLDEIYHAIGEEILNNIPEGEWSEAVLHIEIQPRATTTSAHYLKNNKIIYFEFDPEDDCSDLVVELHKITTKGGSNKWNKATFTLYADYSFDMEFEWDQAYQDEVDRYNDEAEAEHPCYKRPRWHWEE